MLLFLGRLDFKILLLFHIISLEMIGLALNDIYFIIIERLFLGFAK